MTTIRRFVYLLVAFVLLTPAFLTQPVPAYAQDWRDLSADADSDGLPNVVEENGWYNGSGGPYVTNTFDADSDDDGLTDGQEKLYDTDPLDDHSPGIYVEYREDFQTKEYFPWQRYGSNYIAMPYPWGPWGQDSVIVRRGTTFSVGGPADAVFEIDKSISGLTTPTVARDHCAGRWNIYVSPSGTVGIYTIRVQDGSWSESLNLYVIFDLPTDMSDDFISAFIYDESPENRRNGLSRSEASISYGEGEPREYTEDDYDWIPEGEWVNHGQGWAFQNQQYKDWLFEGYVIEIVNGETDTWYAANKLGERVDELTCVSWPRVLSNSWCVLHPSSCGPDYNNKNQCSNIADLLTTFNRAAGIPARPVFTDWQHGTFDHSTEVWAKKPSGGSWKWYVMRGYSIHEWGPSGGCPNPGYKGGYKSLRNPYGHYWGQGVYAAGEDWPWGGINGFSTWADDFRQNSWDNTKIVKKYWWETRFKAYWGWSSEPTVVGTPPGDWPDSIPSPPVAEFTGDPTSGEKPLTVSFTDQSTGHIRSWLWDFGDNHTSTAKNPSHPYEDAGYYTVSLTVQGAGGSDTETKTNYIHVTEPPPVANFSGSPRSGTSPLEVDFTDQSTGGPITNWSWNFGDPGSGPNNTSTVPNPSHIYETTGTFTVQLIVTGPGGSDTEIKENYITVEDGGTMAGFTGGPAPGTRSLEVNLTGRSRGGLGLPLATLVADAPKYLVYLPIIFKESSPDSDESDPDSNGSDPDSVIQFGRVVADYGVDLDGDGRFDQLVFEIQVNVAQAGDYWIHGTLAGDFAEAFENVYLEQGRHTLALSFDGMNIYMSKVDGPYSLEGLWATDVENPAPVDFAENELAYAQPAYQTSPYRFSDFGRAGATLSGKYQHFATDTGDDGYADALVVETGLNIEKAGTYTVQGVLYDGQDEMLSQATWSGSGSEVTLQFDGLRDTTGPYTLQHLHVRNAGGQVTDGITKPYAIGAIPELSARPIRLGVQTTTPADPHEIRPSFVITNSGYSDAGVDTDGDGQFDQLLITVNVEVEAGEGGQAYRVEGWLVDENNSLVSWAISDPQVLTEGVQSLSLAFDGRVINEHGVDGPYTLAALKALPGDTYEVLDEIDVACTTSVYEHDEFEEPVLAPAAGIFADDMEVETEDVDAEDFETGALGTAWTTSSSTGEGRIQVTGDYGTAGGAYALLMDDTNGNGTYTLNEAIWTVDLSGVAEASLSFSHAEWEDELHDFDGDFVGSHNADGIAISDDGTHWHPVFDAPDQADGVWQRYTIDLTAEAAAAGMTLGPNFRIKFQQYDNYPLTGDGRGWDEIVIVSSQWSGQWTAESPWSLSSSVWHSYSHAWEADASDSSGSLTTIPLDISDYANPALRFNTCYNMQSANDVGYLEVSTDGVDWTKVVTYTNATPHWSTELVDLSDYGETPNAQFRFKADSQDGLLWYVDDVWLAGWPAVTSASFTYSPKPALTSEDTTFVASYSSIATTLPITYTWDFDDGLPIVVTDAPAITHQFLSKGDYAVELTVDNPYDSAVLSQPVSVYEPVAETSFSFAPTGPTSDWEAVFTSVYAPPSATQPVTYTWDFGDGGDPVVTTMAIATHEFPVADTYTVWLAATNGYGGEATYSHAVTVPFDDDGDGIPNSVEGTGDADNDGIPNYLDNDSDGDGIPDAIEAGDDPANPVDTDSDGTPDYLDDDSDGDGISDNVEGAGDTDGDGTPNYLDTDADGDGIPDSVEGTDDSDSDGIPNYLDNDDNDGPDGDADGDTILNRDEDITGHEDADDDGIQNKADADSDNDGISDSVEAGDSDPNTLPVDSDDDGLPDFIDPDSDNDTIPDSVEGSGDSDNDGTPNYLDDDSDGDGIPDNVEGAGDTDGDGTPNCLDNDADGDGIADSVEGTADSDGDGIPNYLDNDNNDGPDGDADGDTILNKDEDIPGHEDADGDGVQNKADTDSDNDGIPDSTEAGDSDPNTLPVDSDDDGLPDFIDPDSDGDGYFDSEEGTGDSDGDGIPDYRDPDSHPASELNTIYLPIIFK